MKRAKASGWAALAIVLLLGCGPDVAEEPDGASPAVCFDGERRCDGDWLQRCHDDVFDDERMCPEVCDPQLGCVACAPGIAVCDGEVSRVCAPDGSSYTEETCDVANGQTCNADGRCADPCAPESLGRSYVGCEYRPTVTGNMVSSQYEFAIVIANGTSRAATVTVEDGALDAPESFTVGPDSAAVRRLPWVAPLKLCVGPSWADCIGMQTNGALVPRGSYLVRSDVPVTVYQFNPLDYTLPGATEQSYSNDASLLYPVNAWGTDHVVAAWGPTASSPGLLTVTALADGTEVEITTTADTGAVSGVPLFVAGESQTVILHTGDVLELASTTGDLTGSRVTSNLPVQVIGGHYCANVPDGAAFCDHLEESMLPISALGTRYVVNAPATAVNLEGREQVVRIIATTPGTTITYDPPQPGAPTTIAAAGEHVEIARQAASYLITTDKKVLVAQYMEGSSVAPGPGDPSMALAVPVDQFRTTYMFHAPTNYETSYVDITAPAGATVTLDGQIVPDLVAIGETGFAVTRRQLGPGPAGDGNHRISSVQAFGISVYGYGLDTSYWYAGGLDLDPIVIEFTASR